MKKTRSLSKGILSGLIGGLLGSLAMSQLHALLQEIPSFRTASEPGEDSTVKTASAVSEGAFHHKLTADEKKVAGPAVHYGFGASVGAVYGAAAEVLPAVTSGFGLPFGAAVWLGAHVVTVPALGLAKPVTQSSVLEEAAELGAHLIYGAVVELVRSFLRRR